MAQVKAGDHLRSRVCTTEVIVVRAPGDDATICCGGQPMGRKDETLPAHAGTATEGPGTLLGKRYADDTRGIELLCVKAGSGR